MENARLRAEVATQYAHEAARSLLASDASHMAASLQRSLQMGEPQVRRQPAHIREAELIKCYKQTQKVQCGTASALFPGRLMALLSLQANASTDQAAVARFRAALAAREEVEAHLESELAAARAQAASYEHR